jgi:hypothetical protein
MSFFDKFVFTPLLRIKKDKKGCGFQIPYSAGLKPNRCWRRSTFSKCKARVSA